MANSRHTDLLYQQGANKCQGIARLVDGEAGIATLHAIGTRWSGLISILAEIRVATQLVNHFRIEDSIGT